jgi:hypothetical protein
MIFSKNLLVNPKAILICDYSFYNCSLSNKAVPRPGFITTNNIEILIVFGPLFHD